jgi:hypothetical protein
MLYDLTTLSGPLLKLQDINERALRWVEDAASGRLLGSWSTELGMLGHIVLLRSFESNDALDEERRRTVLSRDPFNGGGLVETLKMERYAKFPFLPDAEPRKLGGFYEIRNYVLKPGGLPPTLEGWRKAIEPAKEYTDHLVINMYALDGPPRITHIWGFESLEQRGKLRAHFYGTGDWPPEGGPEQIYEASSTIALPNKGSPLC